MCRAILYVGGGAYDAERDVCKNLPPDVEPTWENVRFQMEDDAKLVDTSRLGGRRVKGCHSHYVAFTESEAARPERERFVVGDYTNLRNLNERIIVTRKVCLGDPPFCYNRYVPDAMVPYLIGRISGGGSVSLQKELEETTDEGARLRLLICRQSSATRPQPRYSNVPHPSRAPTARAAYAGFMDEEGRPQPWPAAPVAPADHVCEACLNHFVANPAAPGATEAPHFADVCPSAKVPGWRPLYRRGWAAGVPIGRLERVPWYRPLEELCDAPYYNLRDGMLYRMRSLQR